MLTEVTHLQEILESLCMQAGDPFVLPASSEQVIQDLQGTEGTRWTFKVSHYVCKPGRGPVMYASRAGDPFVLPASSE